VDDSIRGRRQWCWNMQERPGAVWEGTSWTKAGPKLPGRAESMGKERGAVLRGEGRRLSLSVCVCAQNKSAVEMARSRDNLDKS
jgi:hypothetical protein